jgi:hypothetical protein
VLVSDTAKALIQTQEYAFDEIFYLIDEIKSGGHDPIGLFWQQSDNENGQDFNDEIYVHHLLEKLLLPFSDNPTKR